MNSQWKICETLPSSVVSLLADVAQRCSASMKIVCCENQRGSGAILVPMAPLVEQSFATLRLAPRQTDSDSVDDQILFLPNDDAVQGTDLLMALLRQQNSLRNANIWLAVSPDCQPADVPSDGVELKEVAGRLEIETESGRKELFNLHAPVQISRVRQLKGLGLGRKAPEDQGDNLKRREEWFRGRTDR